ncbi:polysaccharide pyruvyl transferase WcaK-like protein [Microbacterium terrae]|uniref:Colanic acid biosynthesis protein n=1 Tax=Microbacterium terrae TaxID=69369 RepID=A0A0M2H437_9MICO|nr:polysaccharide pyruvyl transferase family protein [Microbacterium terrae]KJL38461.1 colanic acid biosynthesis protein [Microbacterium terrae]MBP1078896.1 polysaccharide pyruvyl transferase WcaK-like protein [Microbacterium terrae]GLJ98296.1 hypothetical protein GCM10017594_14930 [Microbacterium terrae]
MSLRERMLRPLRDRRLIRAADRLVLTARARAGVTGHVVVAPPGRGNIGDQALVEAFVEAVDGPVHVVVRSVADIDVPEHLADRMTLVPLPALIYGSALGRARDLRMLRPVLAQAATVSVLGADVMDGAYVERASLNRALLVRRAAELGFDARVIGFSWNAAPTPAAIAALRAAGDAGVALYLRDPVSAGRARADGLAVRDAADIVFAARTVDHDAPARWVAGLGADEPLALVNASGLVGVAVDAYTETVRLLRARGIRVAIIPHVSRHGADDMPLCTRIADAFADDAGVTLVPRLLSPREIRGLGARATIAVTGRMHLAVMSMLSATPAVTISTQGKVEGLMQLTGTPQLCVEPGDGFATRLPAAVEDALDHVAELGDTIAGRLPEVVALAQRNVEMHRAAQEVAV